MTKKALLILIMVGILFLIKSFVVLGGYDDPGDSTSAAEGSTDETSETPPEEPEAGPPEDTEDEEVPEEGEACDPDAIPCTLMNLDLRLYCYDEDRHTEEQKEKFVYQDVQRYNGTLYLEDMPKVNEEDFSLNPTFFLNLGSLVAYFTKISVSEDSATENYYAWTESPDPVSIDLNPESDFEKAKLYRFEGKSSGTVAYENGGCTPYTYFYYQMNSTSLSDDGGWFGFESDGDYFGYGQAYHPQYYNDLSFDIIWDENQDQCKAVGGSWLTTTGLYQDAEGNQYNCCGDDTIWLENKVVSEEGTLTNTEIDEIAVGTVSQSLYCLYTTLDVGNDIVVLPVEEVGTGMWSYTCTPTYPAFEAYDITLETDDTYETAYDNGEAINRAPFFFNESGVAETDIGKWSDYNGENPYFCNEGVDDTNQKAFEWIDVNDAGDKSQHICEDLLGSTWTGSHCCGNKYDYKGDFGEVGYYDESFSEPTTIYYADGTTILHQYACAEGTVIGGVNQPGDTPQTAQKEGSDGKEYELLNVNGTLYGCNIGTLSLVGKDWYTQRNLITADTNANPCAKQGSYLCNYNYTDPANPQWEWYSLTTGDLEGKYVKDVLGYSSSTDRFAHSQPAWATAEQQPEACCAGNRCWNGDECVDEHTPYDYDTDADGEEEHYLCSEGQWTGELETKYDWYYNTDGAAINYCPESYSCVCSSNEDDETFCTANDAYVEGGCTLEQDFYTGDHFCEAYTNTDGIDSSRWTSRTKLLAFQLMDIAEAEATDYTLFCDNYTNSLNTWVTVEPIAEDINSFCVLSQNDEITIGVTFNSDDEDEPMTVDVEKLLFGTNGFLSNILDVEDMEDREDCDAALAEDQSTYRFGKYYSCDGKTKKIFYNSKLKALIYSKDRTGTTTLDYPTDDFTSYQTSFDYYRQTILDHLASETIENPAGDPLIEDFASFEHVQDYNRIYYAENSGTSVFGFEDLKYDGETGNRWYLGVVYDGITIDCDQIYAPYETTLKIYCSSDAGIVLERSTTGSEYWNSLTAALRLE